MIQERWQRVHELFDEAVQLSEPERSAYLETACSSDASLRREVLDLLAYDSSSDERVVKAMASVASDVGSESEEDINESIGPYRLQGEIGFGGMGAVYLAHRSDDSFTRRVAIKVIRGWADEEMVRRFHNERKILAALDHPNIARLLDAGTTLAGLPYLVMEYVEGEPIGAYCDRRHIPIAERIELVRLLCDAVHYAHERSVIHRDLKPGNILVTADGTPKLLDFGIAKLLDASADRSDTANTIGGMRLLTPGYASPEQLLGGLATTASDIYVLGLLLYELLTGFRAHQFKGATAEEFARSVAERNPEKPSARLRRAERESAGDLAAGCAARSTSSERLQRLLAGDLDNIVLKALSKEPERRYSSAAALAEDLRCWLEGEPVIARTASLRYIAGKKIRKHWAVSLAIGLLFAIPPVVASYWLRAAREAKQRAEASQYFGQMVERMSADLRLEQFLPLHDTRAAKKRVRLHMAAIRERMAGMGPPADGPGMYAIGAGHLVLGESEAARNWLEKAWMLDNRTPEVALRLGLALSRLYQSGLEEIRLVADAQLRDARKKSLQAQFRDPAARILAQGSGTGELAIYAGGILDLCEERWEPALAKARAASDQLPWLFEAKLLEGDIHLALAADLGLRGEISAARQGHQRAGLLFRAALQMAPSAPDPYERLCFQNAALMGLELDAGGDLPALGKLALDYCRQASIADPERSSAYLDAARIYLTLGTFERRSGRDPLPSLALSEESARKAGLLDPALPQPQSQLASALLMRGANELDRGKDPRPSLEAAIEAYGRALKLGQEDSALYNSMGKTYSYRGDWERGARIDPRPSYALAIAAYKKAIEISPDPPLPHGNLGIAFKDVGEVGMYRGEDPMPLFRQSIESYTAAVARNPAHAQTLNNFSYTWYLIGQYRSFHGEDPENSLKEAEALLTRASAINPKYPNPYFIRGQIGLLRARLALADGGDFQPVLAQARTDLQTAVAINPGHQAQYYAHLGFVELFEARRALEHGAPFAGYLAAARAQAETMRQVRPTAEDRWALLAEARLLEARSQALQGASYEKAFTEAWAEVEQGLRQRASDFMIALGLEIRLYWAEARLARREPATRILDAGILEAQRALAANPDAYRIRALYGALLTVMARSNGDSKTRGQALEVLATAFSRNRYVNREFAAYLEQAKGLAAALPAPPKP